MATTLALLNLKGGVGKTSSVINLAAELRRRDFRVLVVDLDAQANLTQGLGVSDQLDRTLYTLLRREHKLEDVLLTDFDVPDHPHLIPGTMQLALIDLELAARPMRELILARALEPLQSAYDFILLDCPPNFGMLSLNAITSSDYYLIPLQAEYFAVRGLVTLTTAVQELKRETEARVKLLGVFLTRYNAQKNLSRDVEIESRRVLGDKLFRNFVRENIAVAEAQAEGRSIFSYDDMRLKAGRKVPPSNAAIDYRNICAELLERLASV